MMIEFLAAVVGVVLGVLVLDDRLPFWPVAVVFALLVLASKTVVWWIERLARRG